MNALVWRYFDLVRLAAFALIIGAVVDKNRGR